MLKNLLSRSINTKLYFCFASKKDLYGNHFNARCPGQFSICNPR